MIRELGIAPSVGWFFAAGISTIREQSAILREISGIIGIEIPLLLMNPENGRLNELLNEDPYSYCEDGDDFSYNSLHILDYRKHGNTDMNTQIQYLDEIVSRHGVQVVPIHPEKEGRYYPLGYYNELASSLGDIGASLAFENMDKDKPDGINPRELERLVKAVVDVKFVFDVQHAFEHDAMMGYARNLFELVRFRIAHFHVSGQNGANRHVLLHQSANARQIIDFLGWALSQWNVPLILEGEYSREHPGEDIVKEVEFLNKELAG